MTLNNPAGLAIGASFRDPSGFLFRRDGILYRQVNQDYKENYNHLINSRLYEKLVGDGFLIPHEAVDLNPPVPETAYIILRPEPIEFISYPYEWCFSELKDAALVTLEIQKRALEFGMSLKDSSAYNIQFHRGKPVLIDTLSLEIYQENQPWVAYRQFCQHFLAPLCLMALRDVRLSQLLKIHLDGIPLDLVSKLLPARSRFRPAVLMHIHLHAASQGRFASKPVIAGKMSRAAMLGLMESLMDGIKGLNWSPKDSQWGDYYDIHNYSETGFEHKTRLVSKYLENVRPAGVWDLGANTGHFSRLASRAKIPTIAFDVDPGVVELTYRQCSTEKDRYLLPLTSDLTNPAPAIGWQNNERMSLLERGPAEMVLALALIHHLVISNNVPLERLADFFAQISNWLIIEFIPKSDSQIQRLLATRRDIFKRYQQDDFENAFSKYFSFQDVEKIENSERSVYLMRKNNI